MKKETSEELIVKWVDSTLTSDESQALKVLLENDPGLQEDLDGMREARNLLQREIPASVEPPYPDFFNTQLMRKIDLERVSQLPKEKAKRWWRSFQWAWAPAGAMALVLAFLAGQRLGPNGSPVKLAQQEAELPSVYFSEDSLNAEIISDADGHVSVIVVNGLSAISDDASFAKATRSAELPVSYQRSEMKRFH